MKKRIPAKVRIAAEIGLIIGTIAAFDRKCKADEYTDTGEVWDILHHIKVTARRALRLHMGGK